MSCSKCRVIALSPKALAEKVLAQSHARERKAESLGSGGTMSTTYRKGQ